MTRLGVFGGSFDPPHVGHVLAAAYVLATGLVDEVLIVPVYQHVFAKALAPFDDRLAMCRAGLAWLPGVTVSDLERTLGGESRTLRTLEHLAAARPGVALRLVVGSDVLHDVAKWHRFDRIRELAPPIVLGRAGIEPPASDLAIGPPVLPAVSSTQLRRAVAAGEGATLEAYLPAAVRAFVRERGLYRSASDGAGDSA